MRNFVLVGLASLGLVLAGCEEGGGQYASCTNSKDCSAELICTAKGCDFPGFTSEGSPCFTSRECAMGLYCAAAPGATAVSGASSGLCSKVLVGEGEGLEGASCATDANCQPGLRCDFIGLGGSCKKPGPENGTVAASEKGQPCAKQTDCAAGLFCAADNTCASYSQAFTPYAGVDCPIDEGEFRAYFEIPRAGTPLADFFRLPFPNDIRVKADGSVDLSDFPRPGSSPVGVDLVAMYVDAWQQDFDGFSPAAGVIFRFSREVNFDSLQVNIYDITNPDEPTALGSQWNYTTGRTKYNCQNRLHALSSADTPLRAGHRYAFFINPKPPATRVTAADGQTLQVDADFGKMLLEAKPTDSGPEVERAWDQYAPLRTLLKKHYNVTDLATIAGNIPAATVFTVQDVPKHMRQLAAAVSEQPTPVLTELTLCDSGVQSPCEDDSGARSCGVANPDYYEIHGKVSMPIFQAGQPPYLTPEDGGPIVVSNGKPLLARTEAVCFALSIPKKSAMPEFGWPLMVYGHGTGGSMRSFMEQTIKNDTAANESIASKLANATVPMAVLGFDANMHGSRRGASTQSPDVLFFNVVNPRAARDNVLQAAADVLSALRVPTTSIAANLSPTGAEVKFDATQTIYWGHSQGATSGQIALSQSDLSPAVMFSGAGSRLIESLLTKQRPFNTKGGLEFLIGDTVDEFHPVMVLFQSFFDRADAIHHNPLFLRFTPDGLSPKHVYMAFGPGDTYTPDISQQRSAGSLGLGWVQSPDDPTFGNGYGTKTMRPITNNVMVNDQGDIVTRTAAVIRYKTDGCSDGHFVANCRVEAVADWLAFISSYLTTGTPNIP